ncbi:hypothetical protein LCGC14_1081840 [marine sediment metagenome]|uniref:Sialidase domain-containing protein n=1 Tax=marine sediment metagenome TaxID=412755 RepID=A0A0F9MF40_9ZZZZ
MADTTVGTFVSANLNDYNIRLGPIWVDGLTAYVFYTETSADPVYRKTTDGGATWSDVVSLHTGTVFKMSVWYDRWTPGDAGKAIHMAWIETTDDTIVYRRLNLDDDSLSDKITVFAGVSFSGGAWPFAVVDIVKARGGNLYVGFWGDASGEIGFYRSTDNGATWASRAQLADGDEADGILLMPGNETDDNDIWCIYWDRSADELSLKVYDDSADSWSETSIATGMVDSPNFYQMSASPRHSDSHVILAAWSDVDDAAADLKVWDIGSASDIVAKTDVVSNLDVSGAVAVFIAQQDNSIYVVYLKGGVWQVTVDAFYKKSVDGGATWGAETAYSEGAADNLRAICAGISVGADGGRFQPLFLNTDLTTLYVNLTNDVLIVPSVLPLRDAYVGATVDEIPSHGSARS